MVESGSESGTTTTTSTSGSSTTVDATTLMEEINEEKRKKREEERRRKMEQLKVAALVEVTKDIENRKKSTSVSPTRAMLIRSPTPEPDTIPDNTLLGAIKTTTKGQRKARVRNR